MFSKSTRRTKVSPLKPITRLPGLVALSRIVSNCAGSSMGKLLSVHFVRDQKTYRQRHGKTLGGFGGLIDTVWQQPPDSEEDYYFIDAPQPRRVGRDPRAETLFLIHLLSPRPSCRRGLARN